MLSTLKPVAETTLRPVAKLFRHVNPNVLTVLGLVFPVLFFIFLVQEMYVWALLMLILHGADMLDGMVARAQNRVTAFGGFLDSTIDRFADFTVLAAFAFAGLVGWEVVAPLLMLTYLISYIRSRTELAAKGKLTAAVGIIERTERFIVVFFGLLIYGLWPDTTVFGHNLITLAFLMLILLSLITVYQRVMFAYRKLS
jgi:archaetidylinositol phosphate synthase